MSKSLVPMPSNQLVASLATSSNSDVSTSACRVHKSSNELVTCLAMSSHFDESMSKSLVSSNELATSLATSSCESFFLLPTRSSLLPRLHLLDKGGDEGRT